MLLVHLVAVAVLAGVGWTVQLVVYPAFALVAEGEWATYHRRHERAITLVVGLPWLAQGGSVVALAVVDGVSVTVAALGVLALATVVLTVAAAVPAHARLAARRDRADLRGLLRANLARAAAWTASTVVAAGALVG